MRYRGMKPNRRMELFLRTVFSKTMTEKDLMSYRHELTSNPRSMQEALRWASTFKKLIPVKEKCRS